MENVGGHLCNTLIFCSENYINNYLFVYSVMRDTCSCSLP